MVEIAFGNKILKVTPKSRKSCIARLVSNPRQLACAVAAVARSAEERKAMGARGHALIVAEHSWERRAAQTADLVERTVRMRSPA